MRSAGIALIVSGAVVIFFVLHSSVAGSPDFAPLSSSGSSSSGGGSGNGGGSSGPSTSGSDIGSHMGLDSSGNIITIDKPYSGMSDAEKDSANNFAHAHPDGLVTAA